MWVFWEAIKSWFRSRRYGKWNATRVNHSWRSLRSSAVWNVITYQLAAKSPLDQSVSRGYVGSISICDVFVEKSWLPSALFHFGQHWKRNEWNESGIAIVHLSDETTWSSSHVYPGLVSLAPTFLGSVCEVVVAGLLHERILIRTNDGCSSREREKMLRCYGRDISHDVPSRKPCPIRTLKRGSSVGPLA